MTFVNRFYILNEVAFMRDQGISLSHRGGKVMWCMLSHTANGVLYACIENHIYNAAASCGAGFMQRCKRYVILSNDKAQVRYCSQRLCWSFLKKKYPLNLRSCQILPNRGAAFTPTLRSASPWASPVTRCDHIGKKPLGWPSKQ